MKALLIFRNREDVDIHVPDPKGRRYDTIAARMSANSNWIL
jgi:hypothetical protein